MSGSLRRLYLRTPFDTRTFKLRTCPSKQSVPADACRLAQLPSTAWESNAELDSEHVVALLRVMPDLCNDAKNQLAEAEKVSVYYQSRLNRGRRWVSKHRPELKLLSDQEVLTWASRFTVDCGERR